MKYRIYIDEVGNPDLESSDNPNHRFLSLTGVIIELGHVETTVFPQMEALKTRHFRSHPDDPIILHRKEMVNHKHSYHYCLAILMERYFFFLNERSAKGDVMAESRGGKEDLRLKASFAKLWEEGSEYISSERFHAVLTSKQLKVKAKANNVAGLQLADLLAHPSRNEMLQEKGFLDAGLRPFGREIVRILQGKYYQRGGKVYGKKFL